MTARRSLRIVLVRPRDPNNIGAAARAMANFGFDDLVLVDPYAPTWTEARSAIGASSVLRNARVVESLGQAVEDRDFVGATTAGTRRVLGDVRTPAEFVNAANDYGALALVFGNEKHGLTKNDISRCHCAVRIPTDSKQPSMNLGQAVAVCCYVFASPPMEGSVRRPRGGRKARLESLERLLDVALEADGSSTAASLAARRERLRALLLRAGCTEGDISLLRGLLGGRTGSRSSEE